ncbi:hypothetical protein ASPFODRAFT_38467 [Aspergillus luchuensis CBS 106.47]|uniref:Uncharacterized protein n=1 Tax=Aspergillus luchuensis (strain CBS 106.47) TaxID=1137211 RepID=A0A1M3SZR0_ASPLC|nr:hypothetical protein ASPFODRAFT_38467 [Aspergillus luchuensis CBS 106.47]
MFMSSPSSASWEVSSLEVQTSTPDAVDDVLYANGNMQVPVIIAIKAIDPGSGASYELTDSDLDTIKLIDYDDPRYWVTTTKVENKRIGASIEQPNSRVVNTAGAPYDSKVTLTGLAPVRYTLDDLNLNKDNTVSGTLNVDNSTVDWAQQNYYLTTNKHELRKVDLYGYDNGSDNPPREFSTCFVPVAGLLGIFYFWPMGTEEKRTVGTGNYTTEIDVNQRSDALCFTHMEFIAILLSENRHYSEGRFTFYDRFGNIGTFWSGYKDAYTVLEILDHKFEDEDSGYMT